jgi:mannose-6-phosphate isomerase-like protein (cupin superfamily)
MTYVHLGEYEVLSHLETPECSLRLLKLTKGKFVQPHHHHSTTQTYFIIEGTVQVSLGRETVNLQPHQILRVPIDTIHSIRTEGEALILSISIPPLEASDQHVATER